MKARGYQFWYTVVVLLAFAGVLTFQWFRALRADSERFARSREEGRVLVRAITAYKEKNGRWPADLQNLAPTYLPAVPPDWRYSGHADSPPRLQKLSGWHTYLIYCFPPTAEPCFPTGVRAGWIMDNEGTVRYLPDDP